MTARQTSVPTADEEFCTAAPAWAMKDGKKWICSLDTLRPLKLSDAKHPVVMNWHKGVPNKRWRTTRAAALISCTLLTLSGCAQGTLPDDPFAGEGSPLSMVPINHTDRYAVNIFLDKYWAGDESAHQGGGSAACCYPGLKNWSQPVTVRWTWGWEEDPRTKAVTKPDDPHTVIAHFPASGPHSDPDMSRDDAYVCVILRDLDSVDLAFSPSAFACADK